MTNIVGVKNSNLQMLNVAYGNIIVVEVDDRAHMQEIDGEEFWLSTAVVLFKPPPKHLLNDIYSKSISENNEGLKDLYQTVTHVTPTINGRATNGYLIVALRNDTPEELVISYSSPKCKQ
jgi:hypothetical protein